MPSENYDYNYELTEPYVDINQKCFSFDDPLDVKRKFNEQITFRTQTYYRTTFVTPNMCCCQNGGCKPTPEPVPPEPVPPGPCPPPEPEPCPEPDFPDGCFDGVLCNGNLYQTINDAIVDNPEAEEILVGCGTYSLPETLLRGICIKGRGADFTYLSTKPGLHIIYDDVSIMDVSFVGCGDRCAKKAGIVVCAANFFVKDCVFKYGDDRMANLWLTSGGFRLYVINCRFSGSCKCGIKAEDFRGNIKLTSSEFINPVAIDIKSSPECELVAVVCKFSGQVNYECGLADFNGCDFVVGKWKKININPGSNSTFADCTFDNETDTGWVDVSREMEPVIGMIVGCGKTGIIYKFEGCLFTDGSEVTKNIVLLSNGKDYWPGGIFINGEEQEIDNSNWGKIQ